MTAPRLSIITVCYNALTTLPATVASVESQTAADWEHLIIDGGSDDGTVAWLKKHPHPRRRWISEPDRGLYDAMNKGLALAGGRFIHFLNADDRYVDAGVLERLAVRLAGDNPFFGQLRYLRADGVEELQGAPFDRQRELVASRVPQPTLFVPAACYAVVGPFDLRLRIAADYDMLLRLSERFSLHYEPTPVTLMPAGGVSWRRMARTFGEAKMVALRHGLAPLAAEWHRCRRMLRWRARVVVDQWRRGWR